MGMEWKLLQAHFFVAGCKCWADSNQTIPCVCFAFCLFLFFVFSVYAAKQDVNFIPVFLTLGSGLVFMFINCLDPICLMIPVCRNCYDYVVTCVQKLLIDLAKRKAELKADQMHMH